MTVEVMQEYLVKLGYQIDQVSLGKFNGGLTDTSKNILRMGGAVAGVVAAVEASTAAFAYSMRNMYFQSQLAGTSIKNLEAFSYAGKQIGIDAAAMGNAMQSMMRNMRLNPGMEAFIDSLTGRVQHGRPADKIMGDVIDKLRLMPEFVGAQYAQQIFGMDPDTYHLVISQWDSLKQKKEEALDIYAHMGLDPDAAAKEMLDYANSLDRLETRFSALWKVMLIEFSPQLHALNDLVSGAIDWWADWALGINHVSDLFANFTVKDISKIINDATGGMIPGPVRSVGGAVLQEASDLVHAVGFGVDVATGKDHLVMPEERARVGLARRTSSGAITDLSQPTPSGSPVIAPNADSAPFPGRSTALATPVQMPAAQPAAVTRPLFAEIDRRYSLPSGWMDKTYEVESARGTKLMSPKGAAGPMQIIPPTQVEYGVKNPFDLKESAWAMGKKYSDLMREYKGNLEYVRAAYNAGQTAVNKAIALGDLNNDDWKKYLPKETQKDLSRFFASQPRAIDNVDTARLGAAGSSTVNNYNIDTTVTVTAQDTPHKTGAVIAEQVSNSLKSLGRNSKGIGG